MTPADPERLDAAHVMARCRLNWPRLCELQQRGEFPGAIANTNGDEFRRADIEQWKRQRAAAIWQGLGK
jgi:hypothetical protein